jgi:hypothetical protein
MYLNHYYYLHRKKGTYSIDAVTLNETKKTKGKLDQESF